MKAEFCWPGLESPRHGCGVSLLASSKEASRVEAPAARVLAATSPPFLFAIALQSDYNPMEEPSWLHPHESPLPGEGTPTSALTAGASPQQHPVSATDGAAASSPEVSSYAMAAALPQSESADSVAAAAAAADVQEAVTEVAPAPAATAAAAAAAGYDQHPSAEHMVWTNEDGDIDALPWDMGGWSTGSSGEQAGPGQELPQEQRPPLGKPAPADPVDEDALIGALRRKVSQACCVPQDGGAVADAGMRGRVRQGLAGDCLMRTARNAVPVAAACVPLAR